MSELAHLDEGDLFWPNGEQVDVKTIDAWSEHARVNIRPSADDGVVRGPDWVIGELDAISRLAADMAVVVKMSGALKRSRSRVLKRARADARKKHAGVKGPEQTALVDLDVTVEQEEYDDAAIADEYARHISDLVSDRKSTVQTMGKHVEILYRDALSGRHT